MYVTTQEISMVPACQARLRAPFSVLEKMFGTPVANEEGYSTCWLVRRVAEPILGFRIHDEARTAEGFALDAFRRQPFYDWFVEGAGRSALEEFCQWLSAEVIRALGEKPPGRRLTDRARNRMNQLIRQGVPPEAALARCAEWELTPSTSEQFAWPVRDTPGVRDIQAPPAPRKKAARKGPPATKPAPKASPRPPATSKKKSPRPRHAPGKTARKAPTVRQKAAPRKK